MIKPPARIVLNIIPHPKKVAAYLWHAVFENAETIGPYGVGKDPTDAINDLFAVAEEIKAEAAI